ncbi:MAG: hypothetical protein ACOVRN_15820 [Flavobacterium sp.]
MHYAIILVIVSFDKPVYYDMLRIWKERFRANNNVWFIQCKPAGEWIGDIVNDIPMSQHSLRDYLELDRENKTLYVKGDESLIPGILHKTVEALWYFLSTDSTYTHVWRTNLSSVLDLVGLQQYVSIIDKKIGFYGGYVGKAQDIFFASGAGFLLSRDVADYLVANKASLRYDLIDDVAIGALLEPKFGIVPIDRCWVQTGEEDIETLLQQRVFHFRCESYQHLRTVEFMRYVSEKIIKKRCFPHLTRQ